MNSPRFSFDLADIVFDDKVTPDRALLEDKVITRFQEWIHSASRADMHATCLTIDMWLVPSLSSSSMLAVARLIEARFPEVIENMPNLSRQRDHLGRAHQLAQVFQGPNLAALVGALKEEGVR